MDWVEGAWSSGSSIERAALCCVLANFQMISPLKAWFADPERVILMDRYKICSTKIVNEGMIVKADVRAGERRLSKLEQRFNERVTEGILKSLLSVIQGLMRFIPSDRISASQALEQVRVLRPVQSDHGAYLD